MSTIEELEECGVKFQIKIAKTVDDVKVARVIITSHLSVFGKETVAVEMGLDKKIIGKVMVGGDILPTTRYSDRTKTRTAGPSYISAVLVDHTTEVQLPDKWIKGLTELVDKVNLNEEQRIDLRRRQRARQEWIS